MHPGPLRKLASQNAVFKSRFVRGCADRLSKIEARLDHGCGRKWLAETVSCEDLTTLARLLLALQRRCSAVQGLESGWLEELSTLSQTALEEQQAELSRRLMHRLDLIDRAVPPAREPSELLGEVVLKHFKGHGTFLGTVVEYNDVTGFRLQYDDGDTEDVSLRDLQNLMPRSADAEPMSEESESDGSEEKEECAEIDLEVPPGKRQDRKVPLTPRAVQVDVPAQPAQPAQQPPANRKKQLLQESQTSQASETPRSQEAPRSQQTAASAPKPKQSAPPKQPSDVAAASSSSVPVVKRPAPVPVVATEEELAQLPSGWDVEIKGRNKVFISPDGLTRFSTISKCTHAERRASQR